jgi:hypothetical protein
MLTVPDSDGESVSEYVCPEPHVRYALVEQMGFRRTYGTIRETEFAGKPMAEVTPLDGTSVRLVAPESLYQVTWLTREQAEQATRTGAHSRAALAAAVRDDIDSWGPPPFAPLTPEEAAVDAEGDDDTDPDADPDDWDDNAKANR